MPEKPLTPQQEEAVRRRLAEARVDAPMPPEVAARLDEVMAGLAAERAGGEGSPEPTTPERDDAPVVDLAARRRRRRTALLAAAAVVVAGVGVTALLGQGTGSQESAPTAGDAARSATSPAAPEKQGQDELDGSAEAQAPTYAQGRTPDLSAENFAVRAERLRDRAAAGSVEDFVDVGCEVPGPSVSTLQVRYDDRPGVLVYRPVRAGEQRVAVFRCVDGDARFVRGAALPAP